MFGGFTSKWRNLHKVLYEKIIELSVLKVANQLIYGKKKDMQRHVAINDRIKFSLVKKISRKYQNRKICKTKFKIKVLRGREKKICFISFLKASQIKMEEKRNFDFCIDLHATHISSIFSALCFSSSRIKNAFEYKILHFNELYWNLMIWCLYWK